MPKIALDVGDDVGRYRRQVPGIDPQRDHRLLDAVYLDGAETRDPADLDPVEW